MNRVESGEKAQWLKAPTVFADDPGSVPRSHIAAYNYQ